MNFDCSVSSNSLSLKIIYLDFFSTVGLWVGTAAPDDRWWWLWSNWWNEDWRGKPKYSEKTCTSATFFLFGLWGYWHYSHSWPSHSATLSTTNPTCLDAGLNPGRRGGKPATNRLSYGAATSIFLSIVLQLFVGPWPFFFIFLIFYTQCYT
jgi:hypothetical protein